MTEQDLELMSQNAGQAAKLLKAMSNENRLIILCSLIGTELSVSQLNELVPLSQSALSQHLAALRKADLVSIRRESQTIFYQVEGEAPTRVIRVLKDVFCPE